MLVSVLSLALCITGCPDKGSSGHSPGDGHDHDHDTSPVHSEGDGHDHGEHKDGDGHDHGGK